jgi:hypothetical protein
MRNPSRIQDTLMRIGSIWTQHPDLRFGQLIDNCVAYREALYHIEDAELIRTLEEYYNGRD